MLDPSTRTERDSRELGAECSESGAPARHVTPPERPGRRDDPVAPRRKDQRGVGVDQNQGPTRQAHGM